MKQDIGSRVSKKNKAWFVPECLPQLRIISRNQVANMSASALRSKEFGGQAAKICAEMDQISSFPSLPLTTLEWLC